MAMSELSKIIAEVRAEGVAKGEHKCQYCGQGYAKETTLAAHQCEPKRRAQQRGEKGVQIGLQAWLRFYEMSQGSAKTKTYEDFARNQFYTAFVKFGRHCHSINAINVGQFIDYVLKNNIKVDHWCRDKHYEEYLFNLMRTEAAQDALERSIKTMVAWGEEHDLPFNEYFRKVSGPRLMENIRNGRISPWVLYCCDSGLEAAGSLDEFQVTQIMPWIDPDYWQKRLRDYVADAELAKHILSEAGI